MKCLPPSASTLRQKSFRKSHRPETIVHESAPNCLSQKHSAADTVYWVNEASGRKQNLSSSDPLELLQDLGSRYNFFGTHKNSVNAEV